MPDISMCTDDACPTKRECYRHDASGTEPSFRQSYVDMQRPEGREICDNYIPLFRRKSFFSPESDSGVRSE
jgi:hypothetical protein